MKAVSPKGPYRIIGYSFGASVAIEMALQLQRDQSVVSKLILLDGSQSFVSAYTSRTRERLTIAIEDTATAETMAICAFVMQMASRLASDKPVSDRVSRAFHSYND
jgi:fatty acid synthase